MCFKFQIPFVYCWYIGKQLTYLTFILQSCYNPVVAVVLLILFWIFFIDNPVICEYEQFDFLFPNLYPFSFLFLFYSTRRNFQFDIEKEW